MRDIPVSRLMTTEPVTIGPMQTIIEARKLLEAHPMHHLPVVEDGKLVGILSASDMLKFAMLDNDAEVLKSVKVRQVMQASPHVLTVDANLRTAAEKLSSGGFHALPVVTMDRTLVGIVTSSDLIQHLMKQIPTGDGSLRTKSLGSGDGTPEDIDVAAALHEAEVASGRGDDLTDVEKALLALNRRNRQLDAVLQAADRYIRSGHADHEHSVLVKKLEDVRATTTTLSL